MFQRIWSAAELQPVIRILQKIIKTYIKNDLRKEETTHFVVPEGLYPESAKEFIQKMKENRWQTATSLSMDRLQEGMILTTNIIGKENLEEVETIWGEATEKFDSFTNASLTRTFKGKIKDQIKELETKKKLLIPSKFGTSSFAESLRSLKMEDPPSFYKTGGFAKYGRSDDKSAFARVAALKTASPMSISVGPGVYTGDAFTQVRSSRRNSPMEEETKTAQPTRHKSRWREREVWPQQMADAGNWSVKSIFTAPLLKVQKFWSSKPESGD